MFSLEFLPTDIAELEPIIRKWVREEVDCSLSKILVPSSGSGSSADPVGTSEGAVLELRFVNNLPATVFTGSRIEAEDESLIEIELIDSRTNTRVTSGPLSSAKVSILVLNGDFHSDNREDWSEHEFNSSIMREREGRRPLITGDLTVNLRQGLGCLSNITFTDNSSWIRSRRFRLGARILQKVSIQARVKEAASGSFIVKESRGGVLRKHYPPHPKDAVWRLEKIAKGRIFHSRLASQGIYTVEDFLRLLEINPSRLRTIIGPGVPSRTWEAIVAHARTCVLDHSQLFVYSQDSTHAGGLLFDSVYRVVKVTFDGHTYIPVDELTPHQMALMQSLKGQAYANADKLIPVSGPLVSGPPQPMNGGAGRDSFLAPQEPLQVTFRGHRPASDSTPCGSDGLGSQQSGFSRPPSYQTNDIFMTDDIWAEDLNGGIGFPGVFNDENIPGIQT